MTAHATLVETANPSIYNSKPLGYHGRFKAFAFKDQRYLASSRSHLQVKQSWPKAHEEKSWELQVSFQAKPETHPDPQLESPWSWETCSKHFWIFLKHVWVFRNITKHVWNISETCLKHSKAFWNISQTLLKHYETVWNIYETCLK